MKRVICIESTDGICTINGAPMPALVKDFVYHVVEEDSTTYKNRTFITYVLAETGDNNAYDKRYFADAPMSVDEMIEEALTETTSQSCELSV